MPPIDFSKLIDFGRWIETQPGPASGWYVVLGAVFSVGIALGLYLYWFLARNRFRDQRYYAMLSRNIGQGLLWFCILGLIVVFFRIIDVGFFGMRLWLLLDGILGLILLGYLIWYMLRVYPRRMGAINRQRALRAYMPKAGARRHH